MSLDKLWFTCKAWLNFIIAKGIYTSDCFDELDFWDFLAKSCKDYFFKLLGQSGLIQSIFHECQVFLHVKLATFYGLILILLDWSFFISLIILWKSSFRLCSLLPISITTNYKISLTNNKVNMKSCSWRTHQSLKVWRFRPQLLELGLHISTFSG